MLISQDWLYLLFVASGILMRYSNRNNTLPVTRMTPSSWRVCTFINISALCIIHAKPIKNVYTFLVAAPGSTKDLPEDYLARVKLVHESGGYGSKGFNSFPPLFLFLTVTFLKIFISDLNLLSRYGYDWKREEAEKNLLRTHTTAVSTRMLHALAQQV